MLPLLTFSVLLSTACCAVYDYGAYDATRDSFLPGRFPDGFSFSTATAAYQIEGGWNASGKGESIWDRFSHTPGKVDRGDTGDVACDSYNKYREDVQLMKAMGLKYYRFSLSWPRIFPDGTVAGGVNQAGVDYYNNVIDELLANGITPMVTLYHWDLPQALQDRYGGWVNETLVEHFNDYASYVFQAFGDRVRFWLTFNEPNVVCDNGHITGEHAPGIRDPTLLTGYRAGHTLLKVRGLHTQCLRNDDRYLTVCLFIYSKCDGTLHRPTGTTADCIGLQITYSGTRQIYTRRYNVIHNGVREMRNKILRKLESE